MDHNELEKQEEDKKLKIKTDQETKKIYLTLSKWVGLK